MKTNEIKITFSRYPGIKIANMACLVLDYDEAKNNYVYLFDSDWTLTELIAEITDFQAVKSIIVGGCE